MNFVQSNIAKIDEIWQKCTIVVDWQNNFWIEAASFIGAGTVVVYWLNKNLWFNFKIKILPISVTNNA